DGQYSSWTALYPFFEFSDDKRTGDEYQAIVWPFYKHSLRPGQFESTWYWPFYGNYKSANEDSAFYAWPFVWATDETRGEYQFRRRYVVPVWMRRSAGLKGEPADDEEIRSWPFFSWRKRRDGTESVRVPE